MAEDQYPRIVDDWFWTDEDFWLYLPDKGWARLHIQTSQNVYYTVWFYDLVNVRQEMENSVQAGTPCYTEFEPIVIVSEVSRESILASVKFLWEKDYFSHWKPDVEYTA